MIDIGASSLIAMNRFHIPEIGCKRLILTYMNTDMIRRLAEIDVETAEDGKSITI